MVQTEDHFCQAITQYTCVCGRKYKYNNTKKVGGSAFYAVLGQGYTTRVISHG
jgi:hypothetical protein